MPQFISIVRATRAGMLTGGPTPEEASVIEHHFRYVQDLVQQGTALLVGRTTRHDPDTFGLVIFRADDEEAAVRLAAADPAVAEGVMAAEVHPFDVLLLSQTWESEP
jgi:uncharacterized protein YciI